MDAFDDIAAAFGGPVRPKGKPVGQSVGTAGTRALGRTGVARADDAGGSPGVDITDPLLDGLTPSQRRAVEHVEGPLLVLAGPGSGKTRVITRRIAHLIRMGVPPWNILAVTFTNKAAGEMKHRVEALLGGGPGGADGGASGTRSGPTICTFHSLCVRLLRRYVEHKDVRNPNEQSLADQGVLRPGFTVMDADDQGKLVKAVLNELQLSSTNFPPRSVQEAISKAKNDLLDAGDFAQRASDFYTRTMARAYEKYQAQLRQANACDFDDLLLLTARMLRTVGSVRAECRRRFPFILIDEYQDTNRSQLVIATLLAGEGGGGGVGPNICVVGDPDQSIYAWRGADITNILSFEEHYAGASVIALGENFRSRAPIISVADRLINRNTQRRHKPLVSTRAGGEKVELVLTRDEHHEARLVVDWLRARKQEGTRAGREVSWKDCAVFYRTNALSRVIEDAMRSAAIPYVMVRGTAFFQREEVKTALAYLRVVANPDDRVSVERVINTPARGISDRTWDAVVSQASVLGVSVTEMLERAEQVQGLTPRAVNAVGKFLAMLEGWRRPPTDSLAGVVAEPTLAELVDRVVRESGLQELYAKEEDRVENLAELVSSAADFEQQLLGGAFDLEDGTPAEDRVWTLAEKLAAYLERTALVADTDAINPQTGAVTLMTLHAAKGLEYPVVAMIGLEEGCLPHIRGLDDPAALEEERRLCFVGVTRAMDRLLLTSASFRTVRGLAERTMPSRFLDELKGPEVSLSDQGYSNFSVRGGRGGFDEGAGGFDDDGPAVHIDELDQRTGHDEQDGPARGAARSGSGPGFGTPRGVGAEGPGRSGQRLAPGHVVRHPQFGMGVVKSLTPGANARVQVEFKHGGLKTLVLEFARLERLG
jgi:DNA helicase-2/ATP-dependent DNA helicase PcrA